MICRVCNMDKDNTDFPIVNTKNNFKKMGTKQEKIFETECKECRNERGKLWRKNNPGYTAKQRKLFKPPTEDKLLYSAIGQRMTDLKSRVKKTRTGAKEFTITKQWLYDKFKQQNGFCAISGIEMLISKHTVYSLSVDRIDNTKGYTKDNTHWVILAVNRGKWEMTQEEYCYICKKVNEKCNDYPEKE